MTFSSVGSFSAAYGRTIPSLRGMRNLPKRHKTFLLTLKSPFHRTPSPEATAQEGKHQPVTVSPLGLDLSSQRPSLLWEKSILALSAGDQETLTCSDPDKLDILNKVLDATTETHRLCRQKGWKVTLKGETIVLRDVAERIITWVDKFKSVGDLAMQYDPSHAAIPWAAFRFLLKVITNDCQTFGAILVGLEKIAKLLGRCAIYEALYLRSGSEVSENTVIEESMTELYAGILLYLARAKQYLVKNTGARLASGVFASDGFSYLLVDLDNQESTLIKETRIAEAEYQRLVYQSLNHRISEESTQLREGLERLKVPISRVESGMKDLHDTQRTKILQWISQVEYTKHHWNAQEGRLAGTGEWLLRKPEFREWHSSSVSTILWLHGIPGSGKTKLTSMVVDTILHDQKTSTTDAAVAFFYCRRDETGPSDPEIILRAIVKQLSYLGDDSPLRKPVMGIYEARKRDGFSAGPLGFQESLDLIISLVPDYQQATIVIDALDESDPVKRQRFLRALEQIVRCSAGLVKVFISSRDDDDIVLRLEKVPNLYIEAADNIGDLERFVRAEVSQCIEQQVLLRGRVSDELKNNLISVLINGAHGMFLWAELQIKEICTMSVEQDVWDCLGKLPETLDKTYAGIYERVMLENGSGPKLARRALMWVMCSCRPFSPNELAAVISLQNSGSGLHQLDADVVFRLCHNLLTLDRQLNIVRFAHLSVREFLEKHHFSAVDANSMAAEFCFSILTDRVYGVERPEPKLRLPNHPATEYATLYWPTHVQLCLNQQTSGGLAATLESFLRSYSLHWYRAAKTVLESMPYSEAKTIPLYSDITHLEFEAIPPLCVATLFGFGAKIESMWRSGTWDVNRQNRHGESLLYLASERGYAWIVTTLLRKGANPVASGGKYGNALQAASYGGHETTVAILLKSGADVNAQGGFYHGALQAASANGNAAVVRLLLETGANASAQGGNCGNALHAAAHGGHCEVVGMLLGWGANVNADLALNQTPLGDLPRKDYGSTIAAGLEDGPSYAGLSLTPLETAAAKGDDELVQTLLNDGAYGNSRGGAYGNALRLAASAGHDSVVHLLLENEAETTGQAGYYRTALQAAAAKGHERVVEILVANGADVNGNNDNYGNVLQSGAYSGNFKTVAILLANGAEANAKGGFARSALEVAAAIGHERMVDTLLRSGAQIESRGAKYGTALQAAAFGGHVKVIAMLLAHGADVNAEGGECGNALRAAAMEGHAKAVAMLVERGADVNTTSGSGSALAAAVAGKHGKVVEILLDNGADRTTSTGRLALLMAAENGYTGLEELLQARVPFPVKR